MAGALRVHRVDLVTALQRAHDELLDAILGITPLNVPSYLLILATQDTPTPPPPAGGVFPSQVEAFPWPILASRPTGARPTEVRP